MVKHAVEKAKKRKSEEAKAAVVAAAAAAVAAAAAAEVGEVAEGLVDDEQDAVSNVDKATSGLREGEEQEAWLCARRLEARERRLERQRNRCS